MNLSTCRAVASALPLLSRLRGAQTEVTKHQVQLYGRRIAYRGGGSGPPLLLIHGITSNSATWDKVLPALATQHTVIAPDLLGHGKSDKGRDDYSPAAHANTLRDLLDSLGHDRVTVVGHSLGGGVAMQLGYQYPERIDRLVLVAPGGFGPEVNLLLRLASLPGSGGALALAAWRPFVEAGTWLTQQLGRLGMHGGTDLEEIGRAYSLLADSASRSAFLHTLRSVIDLHGQRPSALDRTEVMSRVPTLIVWGDRDRILPAAHGDRIHRLVPNTYLADFQGAGHFPHRDDPARFVHVVEEFLARERRLEVRTGRPRPARAARTAVRATA